MKKSMRIRDQCSCGFAVYLVLSSTSAWGLLWFSSTSFYDNLPPESETIRSIGFIGTLLVFGLVCLYLPSLGKRDASRFSALCLLVGYLGFFLQILFRNDVLQDISVFLVGVGSSSSFIIWQCIFAEKELNESSRLIIAGSALSAVFYLLITFMHCPPLYPLIIFICVIFNYILLRRCRGKALDHQPTVIAVEQNGSIVLTNVLSNTWRYMLSIAAIGYVSGVSCLFAKQNGENLFFLNVALSFGMLVAVIGLAFFWNNLRDSISFSTLYTGLFIVVMTGFLFLPFFGVGYCLFFAGLANAAFAIVSMLMMITCLKIAYLRHIEPVAVFGVFASIVYGAVFLGRLAADAVGQAYSVSRVLVIALMSSYVLSFAGVIINIHRSGKVDTAFDPIKDVEQDLHNDDTDRKSNDSLWARGAETMAPKKEVSRLVRRVVVTQDLIPIYSNILKKSYGLSKRETDVLELIIRGRDVTRIAETLFVSENTIRSHCKNLYRKLDIHNRQQLFDLVEECRKGEYGSD